MRTERELLIVRVLDQQRNFGRAASLLNMTQPALSRALQRIEKDHEFRLFDRSKTPVAPTAQCQAVLEHADGLMKGFADLRRTVSVRHPQDQLRFDLASSLRAWRCTQGLHRCSCGNSVREEPRFFE
jgi:DNA-binding transcriptional LysR family regulator